MLYLLGFLTGPTKIVKVIQCKSYPESTLLIPQVRVLYLSIKLPYGFFGEAGVTECQHRQQPQFLHTTISSSDPLQNFIEYRLSHNNEASWASGTKNFKISLNSNNLFFWPFKIENWENEVFRQIWLREITGGTLISVLPNLIISQSSRYFNNSGQVCSMKYRLTYLYHAVRSAKYSMRRTQRHFFKKMKRLCNLINVLK